MISIPRSLFTDADAAEIAEEVGVRVTLTTSPHFILSPTTAAEAWEAAADVIGAILADRAEDRAEAAAKPWREELDSEVAAIFAKMEAGVQEKAPRRFRPLPTDEDRASW